jgi:hypothetical protein
MAVDQKYDGLYQLRTHADHLNSIDTPDPAAKAFFEIMSGAIVWSDETNARAPVYVTWALRELFAYRTQLMLNNEEPNNHFWDQCTALFPNWIGFLPERRRPTPEALAEYRRGDVSLKWCLRKAERELDCDST